MTRSDFDAAYQRMPIEGGHILRPNEPPAVPIGTPKTGFVRGLRSRTSTRVVVVAVGLLLAISALVPRLAAQDDSAAGFVVIVHADNPTTSVERKQLGKIFLKKIKRWEVGEFEESITAFDLEEDSSVREEFTREVHGKSVSAIKSYWQRMIFSGRDVPPDDVSDDAEMIAAVAEDLGAVGYVSSDAELGDSVKTIEVVED